MLGQPRQGREAQWLCEVARAEDVPNISVGQLMAGEVTSLPLGISQK